MCLETITEKTGWLGFLSPRRASKGQPTKRQMQGNRSAEPAEANQPSGKCGETLGNRHTARIRLVYVYYPESRWFNAPRKQGGKYNLDLILQGLGKYKTIYVFVIQNVFGNNNQKKLADWVFQRPAEPAEANRPSGDCRETEPPRQQRPTDRAANAGQPACGTYTSIIKKVDDLMFHGSRGQIQSRFTFPRLGLPSG